MRIHFLGTGTSQGIPVISCHCSVCQSNSKKDKRLRTSVLISDGETNVSIDCSPDFRTQMLRANCQHLDAIVFTHEHQDHVAGLDDVRPFNFKSKKPMELFASWRVTQRIKEMYSYAFEENKYPGAPQYNMNVIEDESFWIGTLKFEIIKVWHGQWPVLGFRVNNFVYITDANKIEDIEFEKMKGADVLVLNALRREEHYAHFNLEQAIDLINKSGAKKGYLTHLSHQMGLYQEVSDELPNHIYLAYDGLEIRV